MVRAETHWLAKVISAIVEATPLTTSVQLLPPAAEAEARLAGQQSVERALGGADALGPGFDVCADE